MKKNITITIIGTILLIAFSCQSQDEKSIFGKYYKIGKYNVLVPFHDQPHVSPIQENEQAKVINYTYAYPTPEDDINDSYGIEICQLKDKSLFSDTYSKIDFLVNKRKEMFQTVHGGELIKQEEDKFKGQFAIRQKIKINIPDVGEDFITSLYFIHDDLIIRLFVITPVNDDGNKKITEFFESIKFE
ncbi:MAG: hypothetical protein ABI207_01690 [Crocinitomicaceae bacterium]